MLHVGVCWNSLASMILLKESTEVKITRYFQPDLLLGNGWGSTDHPPKWPDLGPSDFHLFGLLRELLVDQRLAIDVDVKQAVTSLLQTHDTGIQALAQWWNKCLNFNGAYMEVWCVPSAAHVLCISRSQVKVVGVIVPRTLFF